MNENEHQDAIQNYINFINEYRKNRYERNNLYIGQGLILKDGIAEQGAKQYYKQLKQCGFNAADIREIRRYAVLYHMINYAVGDPDESRYITTYSKSGTINQEQNYKIEIFNISDTPFTVEVHSTQDGENTDTVTHYIINGNTICTRGFNHNPTFDYPDITHTFKYAKIIDEIGRIYTEDILPLDECVKLLDDSLSMNKTHQQSGIIKWLKSFEPMDGYTIPFTPKKRSTE